MFCYIAGVGGTVASGLVSLTLEHLQQVVWVNEPWPWILCCVLEQDTFKLLSQYSASFHPGVEMGLKIF